MRAAVLIDPAEMGKVVPKMALTHDEVVFALGSRGLVEDLRAIEVLAGKRAGRTLLFDAELVGRVWSAWRDGEYDERLRNLKNNKPKN